jgi:hypothetical protein
MFSKFSRYRPLAEVHTQDAAGRRLASKELRLLPETTGVFGHSIEAADRLDHLAYKYYRQPTRWWRICNANPEFLSPLDLLGQGPLASIRVPLTHDDTSGAPPWSALVRSLRATPGVDDVIVEEDLTELVTVQTTIGSSTVSYTRPAVTRAVVVAYHRLTLTLAQVSDIIAATGFEPGPPQPLGQVGKEILLPPRRAGG